MKRSDTGIAREAVLRTFQWVNGDASFTAMFKDADTLRSLGPGLVEPFREDRITIVTSPEARGFILGALCAAILGVGFLAARKAGFPRPEDRQATAIAEAIAQMGCALAGTALIVDQAPEHVREALNVVGLLRRDELPPPLALKPTHPPCIEVQHQ